LESEAAIAASRAAEVARKKAVEAAEKAKADAAARAAGTKTPTTRGRGILKNTMPTGSTRGGAGRGAPSQTGGVRGRGGIVRGTRGTASSSTRGSSVRGRGSLVK
jgi:membrane protein involved in colicin uptake